VLRSGRRTQKKGDFVIIGIPGDIFCKLETTIIFPILHKEELLGLLGVKEHGGILFDKEDMTVITVFARSIGMVYHEHRLLQEKIEHEKFDSFNRIASFVIHDVKNQVSTLRLLTRNAEKNINNPAFQQSIMKSITQCSDNLQKLIDKFSSPLKQDEIVTTVQDINPITNEVINAIGLHSIPSITLKTNLAATTYVAVDTTTISFILKNFIVNALEAMDNRGEMDICTFNLANIPDAVSELCAISEFIQSRYSVAIAVKDTGRGMSEAFIQNQLFRPFSTSKDKGVGIGLYQCKVLIEKMGGRIGVGSQKGEGSVFCIFL
jgi:hypothetical protein